MSKYTDQDIIDENGGKILANALDAKFIFLSPNGSKDSTADIDGWLRLRDGKGNNLNKKLDYQLKSKGEVKNNIFYFPRGVIDYQLTCNTHTITLVVDVGRKKVFWYYFPEKIDELQLNADSKGRSIELTDFEINGNCDQLKNIWEKIASTVPPQSGPPSSGSSGLEPDASILKSETPSQVQSVLDYSVISEYQSELNLARDLINKRQPKAAMTILEDLKQRAWSSSDDAVKFRILTNMGAVKLSLEEESEACKLFIEAYQYNTKDEKAISNLALAYLLTGVKTNAVKFAKKALGKNPGNQQALSVFLQAADRDKREKLMSELPASIKNSPEVYFSLGFVELKNDNYEKSVLYLRKAVELDEDKSLEIPSTLAGVLIEKNVPVLKKLEIEGLKEKQNEEVEEAISLLNHVWGKVEITEMAKAKVSWLINRSFAKRILGRIDEALVDAKKASELVPDNFNGIKNYAILCWEIGKFEEAYKLLEPFKGSKEFPQASYLLALMKREQKDFDAAIELIKGEFNKKDIPAFHRDDGLALLLETYLMAGKLDEAERLIVKELKRDDKKLLLLVFGSKLYKERKNELQAKAEILKAFSLLGDISSYNDKFMIASQLYRLKLFKEAQRIYEEIIDKTVYSQLLYKLLYSYYETNSYAKALALTRAITKTHGAIEDVLKIQAAILEEQGDLDGVLATYELLLKNNPNDTPAKIQKGYILVRQNRLEEADKYLDEMEFDLESLSLMSRYRLAYLFSVRGKWGKFLNTLYETRRKFIDDKRAHIEYINLFLLRAPETDKLLDAKEIKNGVAVYLKYPNGSVEHYVIDDRVDSSKALKEISPNDELAKKLIGKKLGESIELSPRLFVEIKEIKSKYVHALHESMALHQALFNDTPDLQSIHLGEPQKEGELPEGFKVIEQQITAQYQHAEKVEALYKNKQITIGAFARLIGRNLIEAWGGMVADEKLGVNYSRGDLQERVQAVAQLKKDVKLVIDPIALLTIHSLEIGDLIVNSYGQLGISQSSIDLITEQITRLQPIKDKGYLTLGKQGEQFTKWEVKPETIKKNIKYLEGLINWISKNCDVLPIEKVDDISKEKKEKLEEILGIPSIDTLLICRVEKRLLFSDDERLRTVSKNDYGIEGIWTQALLMNALGKGRIEQEQYDDLVIKLVGLNYYYTSVSGKNLFFALKKSNWKVEQAFIASLKMLNPSFSDTSSAIGVCVDFLYEVFTNSMVMGDIDGIIFEVLDNLTKDRRIGEVIPLLKKELASKFYLLLLDLNKINKVIESWSKTKIY